MSTIWEGYGEDSDGDGDGDGPHCSTSAHAVAPAAAGKEELWECCGTHGDGGGSAAAAAAAAHALSPQRWEELEGLGADAELAAEPAHTNARPLRARPPAATAGSAAAAVAAAVASASIAILPTPPPPPPPPFVGSGFESIQGPVASSPSSLPQLTQLSSLVPGGADPAVVPGLPASELDRKAPSKKKKKKKKKTKFGSSGTSTAPSAREGGKPGRGSSDNVNGSEGSSTADQRATLLAKQATAVGVEVEQAVFCVTDTAHGTYTCQICGTVCRNVKDWASHARSKRHTARRAAQDAPAPWRMAELQAFPCRETTLDHHVMVADLDPVLRARLDAYLRDRCPHSPELVDIVKYIADNYPRHLRVKELVETIEGAVQIGQEIYLQHAERPISAVYDMACGHGLLGILLAYRFAEVKVVCVDTTKRPCFDQYVGAFQKLGAPAPNEATCSLSNVVFVEDDINNVKVGGGHGDAGGGGAPFLVGIHGCNEATKVLVEMAQRLGCGFAMMPCCIREDLYNVRTHTNKGSIGDDDQRYALMVGVVAGQCGAHRISAIDRQITNRNLILYGKA